jgi:hypothetical protein
MFYSLRARFALSSLFDYEVAQQTSQTWKDCLRASKNSDVPPAEAAAMFMEVCCLMMTAPLDKKATQFVLDKIDAMRDAMRRGGLENANCVRVARLYAYARGASRQDAEAFAMKTVVKWASRDMVSNDGTEIRLTHRQVPISTALAIEFDRQGVTGRTDTERSKYAEELEKQQMQETMDMLLAIARETENPALG